MDYLWIMIPVALVVALATVLGIKLRNKTRNSVETAVSEKALVPVAIETTDIEKVQESGIAIPSEAFVASEATI